jgi:hypothetical protein
MQNHWQGYITALSATPIPSSSHPAVGTFKPSDDTGFLNLNPKNSEVQARYDAMSPSWEGVTASVKSGVFNTEFAQLKPTK